VLKLCIFSHSNSGERCGRSLVIVLSPYT
jgi:hypothetical protein